MSKPIEPGCLVLILRARDPRFIGKCGTVIGQEHGYFQSRDGVMVDGRGWWDVEVPGVDVLVCRPASSLLRIDGDDHVTTEEREDVEMPA
ncbi:hypothetical protein [Halomonas caseinilytica]|uniref:hypothetical protein n=1 Tax=Halomonas caseinilytica TaxID=438744 RepID=UPI000848D3F5|nr:hypothetical protein [Halomonas caseinilytica]